MTTSRSIRKAGPRDLERLLADAYAVEIPTHLAVALDERTAALTRWRGEDASRSRPAPARWRLAPPRWRRMSPIPVLVAILITTAVLMTGISASGGPAGFYETEGGYRWQHAENLTLTETVDDYRITLERAYADANQMMAAITVVDAGGRSSQADIGGVAVSDSAGVRWQNFMGVGGPVGGSTTANMVYFRSEPGAAPAGRREFTLTVASVFVGSPDGQGLEVDVNATFTFELTVLGGYETAPDVSAESDGVTMTVEWIVVSPSTVRVDVSLTGAPASGRGWLPILSVSHDGTLPGGFSVASLDGTLTTAYTTEGVEDPSGDWTISAGELMGSAPTPGSSWEQDVRLQGNWSIHFTLP